MFQTKLSPRHGRVNSSSCPECKGEYALDECCPNFSLELANLEEHENFQDDTPTKITPTKVTKTMKEIALKDALQRIQESNGAAFAVMFMKRSTGNMREMRCNTSADGTVGGERAYDFEEKGLIPVFDQDKQERRSIPIEGLRSIKFGSDEEWCKVIPSKKKKKQ